MCTEARWLRVIVELPCLGLGLRLSHRDFMESGLSSTRVRFGFYRKQAQTSDKQIPGALTL